MTLSATVLTMALSKRMKQYSFLENKCECKESFSLIFAGILHFWTRSNMLKVCAFSVDFCVIFYLKFNYCYDILIMYEKHSFILSIEKKKISLYLTHNFIKLQT